MKIKLYNKSTGGVDITDNKTADFRLNRKSKYCFYLRMFFDLKDVAFANSHTAYTKRGNNISLLNFKVDFPF